MEIRLKDITLRTVTQEDLQEVARMWNFEKGEISLQESAKAIEWMKGNHQQNRLHKIVHLCFAVFAKDSNRIIGWCGLDGRNNNQVHIFYLIDKEYRGRGYATECAKKLLEYGFREMEIARIDGSCAKDNIASQTILAKTGMQENKEEHPEDGSHHYFMTRQDYLNCR